MLFENTKKDILVNRSKELPNITFERPHSPGMVARSLASEASEAVEGFMDSFIISARIRISDKQSVEKRIEDAVNGSMDYPVSHSRFMDISWLRVRDIESLVARMTIGFESKFSVD